MRTTLLALSLLALAIGTSVLVAPEASAATCYGAWYGGGFCRGVYVFDNGAYCFGYYDNYAGTCHV